MTSAAFTPRRLDASAKPPRVAVLMGGPSSEAAVSLNSGRAIAAALDEAGFLVEPIAFETAALPPIPAGVDVVFPALHGAFGEDGQIQGLLEDAGYPYVGTGVAGSRLIMDKRESKAVVAAAGVPAIPGTCVNSPDAPLPRELPLPLMVKPNTQGSTIGATRVDRPEQWAEALTVAMCHDREVVVERYITGPELTVGLIDGIPLPVIQIKPPGDYYDYDAKYTYAHGRTEYFCPPRDVGAAVTARTQELAAGSYTALGARDLLRVDLLVDEATGEIYFMEANSIPGFTATSLLPKAAAAAGVSFAALCAHLVLTAAARGQSRM